MSGAISAVRWVRRGAARYVLPLLLVVTVGAMPGTVLPEDEPEDEPYAVRWDDDQSGSSDAIDPRRPTPDEPSAELVSAALETTTTRPSAPVVGALSASGIPDVALRAYQAAQATMAVDDPGCGLRWSLVAAIGRVESNHGRFAGSQLRSDGTTTRPIRGIPLDGRTGVATIRDTDDGVLDGDLVYDRAVGPMQFIPSSWSFAGADGNGDGRKDPDNIFDAALAAAGYLCAGDTDLREPAQRASAVFRYNHSDEYVAVVLALAEQYERGVTPVPSVPTTGTSPHLPSPQLPPASVTRPPLGQGPGGGPSSTTSTTPTTRPSTTPWTPGSTMPSSTTSSTTTTTTTTGVPCPTTTTTSSAVPDPSSSTTTSTTTTTVAPGPTSSTATSTTVPPGCPTTTAAPGVSTTSAPPDLGVVVGGLAFLPLYLVYRRRSRGRRRLRGQP